MRGKMLFGFALVLGGLIPVGMVSVRAESPQEVKIALTDYKIASSTTRFEKGKPYRFVIVNAGEKDHEWLIAPPGKDKPLIEVEEEDLGPGKTVSRDFTFKQAGAYEFSCHYRNHYRKGMKLAITVN